LHLGLGISKKKNNSTEDRINGTKVFSDGMLGIPYRGTKIEAKSRKFVQNHSAEEKTTLGHFLKLYHKHEFFCIPVLIFLGHNSTFCNFE
jgi:hypothetical protein